jgi:hypothetical protein
METGAMPFAGIYTFVGERNFCEEVVFSRWIQGLKPATLFRS